MSPREISKHLQNYARELQTMNGNLYRVQSYRRAAFQLQQIPGDLASMTVEDLMRVPGIGHHLAVVISHVARTGEFRTFEQLAA
jgi:DNA polymerase (family X)